MRGEMWRWIYASEKNESIIFIMMIRIRIIKSFLLVFLRLMVDVASLFSAPWRSAREGWEEIWLKHCASSQNIFLQHQNSCNHYTFTYTFTERERERERERLQMVQCSQSQKQTACSATNGQRRRSQREKERESYTSDPTLDTMRGSDWEVMRKSSLIHFRQQTDPAAIELLLLSTTLDAPYRPGRK